MTERGTQATFGRAGAVFAVLTLPMLLAACSGASSSGTSAADTPAPMWTQGREIDRQSPSSALESILKAHASKMLDLCDELPEPGSSPIEQVDRAMDCDVWDAIVANSTPTDIKVENVTFVAQDTAMVKGVEISAPTADGTPWSSYLGERSLFTMTKSADGWHLTEISEW